MTREDFGRGQFPDDEDRDGFETSACLPFNHLKRLRAREYFIEFSRPECIRLYKGSYKIQAFYELYCTADVLKVTVLELNVIITEGLNFLVNYTHLLTSLL